MPAPACPKQGAQVTLHEVPSRREGTRYVLEHTGTGATFELPQGERDAFVWKLLTGASGLDAIAQAYLAEFGSIHPALGDLVRQLAEADLVEGVPVPKDPGDTTGLGSGLIAAFAKVVMIRLPIAALTGVWGGIGKVAAPIYHPILASLAVLFGLSGVARVFYLPSALHGPPAGLAGLFEWPGATAYPYLLGILLLLAINLLVDVCEGIGQVAILARGKRGPAHVALSFDAGVPGVSIETPAALLLPSEQRIPLYLAPLLTALTLGGCASLAVQYAAASLGPLLLSLLYKLAWVALLRAVVHLQPLGPSPFYDALRTWFGMPRLRQLALATLRARLGIVGHAARQELRVFAYLGLVLVYLVLTVRLGVYLELRELAPLWHAAFQSKDAWRTAVLLLPMVAVALPTLLALMVVLVLTLQAAGRGLVKAGVADTPTHLAGSGALA
ncbi:PqqD family protein, partial [Planctomycetota bacterium]|nr:PqqD family protein [Planctomycetota bacterium]